LRDGSRASDVISRLRALFGKRAAVMDTLNLNDAAREVVALSKGDLLRAQVVLQVDLSDDLQPITGDRIQLQQVMLNLIRNAADAMSKVDDRPRRLLISTSHDENDHVRFSVQDAGVGLNPAEMDRLFEAFYTTKQAGMGIGLTVCRSIIESHNGRLWARPNEGHGATFSFSIPRLHHPTP
jgi:signal transduction histidine kinase